jgi:hypothetical protein
MCIIKKSNPPVVLVNLKPVSLSAHHSVRADRNRHPDGPLIINSAAELVK